MGFAFQVIEVAAWRCLATSTVPLRSILRTMIFCPFRLSPWSPWLIKFQRSYGCMYRDWWWCIVEGWYPSLIIPFDLCIWWRWSSWYYLWIIPGQLWSFFLWPLFQLYLFFPRSCCLFSSYLTSLAFWHFTLGFYTASIIFRNFLYLFLIYFPRWILTIFADLFGCVKLLPDTTQVFASNIRAQN